MLSLQLRLLEAGYVVEAQELELYKSEVVFNSEETRVKTEYGDYVHPRVAEIYQLLGKGQSNQVNITKTSRAVRAAIINAALQRPMSKKCMHCHENLKTVRYMHHKLVYYISIAEMKSKYVLVNDFASSKHIPNIYIIFRFSDKEGLSGQHKVILADECRKFLRQVYENHPEMLKLFFPVLQLVCKSKNTDFCPVDIFFMDTIPVTPPKARPSNILHDQIVEHAQTGLYRNIIENNSVIRVIMKHIKGDCMDMSEEAQVRMIGILYQKLN